MSDTPPIARELWDEVLDFLKARRTGQITFHVTRGEVHVLDCTAVTRAGMPTPRANEGGMSAGGEGSP
jgi:hypothetical protein